MASNVRRLLFSVTATLIVVITCGGPLVLVATPGLLFPKAAVIVPALLMGPVAYSVAFVLLAGLASRPFQSAIVPGKFPRDLGHTIYARRRLYGLCWTLVYYFKPVYAICLALPGLRVFLFRLFGYRGPTDFTVYPDTWIRDLPLLYFGKGAYVANRATLGTNIALSNGSILVDRVHLGDGAMVGHLTMLGPGVKLGRRAEVAVGCAIGIRCELGAESLIQPTCALNHHVRIGEKSIVGSMSYIGAGARIAPGVLVPPGSLVRGRARIDDADALTAVISSELDLRQFSLSSRAAVVAHASGAAKPTEDRVLYGRT